MKSENTKWSDKDVDEILTSFFLTEVPAQLERPLQVARPVAAAAIPAAVAVPRQAIQSGPRWKNFTMTACAAALVLAAAVAFQFNNNGDQSGASGVVVTPMEEDAPINVSDHESDDSDISVPEQDIEFAD